MKFISPDFQSLMAEATRLTLAQGDSLQAATAALQAAFTGGAVPAPATDSLNVMEVEAREIRPDDAPQPSTPASAPAHEAQPAAAAPNGEFLSARYTDASAGSREYKLYIPPGATDGPPLPLVVMLHGCSQNPDDFALGTGMNEAARQRGFYVLYPAQTQSANASGCWNWFKHNHQGRGRGEPALLAGMTQLVMANGNIDPQRVYVAGLSAGGSMAAILGDAYPELFAAVGVHSGLATGAASDMTSAFSAMQSGAAPRAHATASPPTIVFHGDQDTTVHPSNGEQVAASAGGLVSESQLAHSSDGREYTVRTYRDAHGRVRAEHWVIHGAGHAWSGGHPPGSFTDAKGPDATAQMLRFFWERELSIAH